MRSDHSLTTGTHAECQVLHHITHSHSSHGVFPLAISVSQKILDAPVGIDLHGAKVVIAVNETSFFSKFLTKSIAQVVRGVGRDQQDRFAGFGELDGQRAGGGGFTHTTFASHENPAKSVLV